MKSKTQVRECQGCNNENVSCSYVRVGFFGFHKWLCNKCNPNLMDVIDIL